MSLKETEKHVLLLGLLNYKHATIMMSSERQVSPQKAVDDKEAGECLPLFLHHLTKGLEGTSVKEEAGQLLRLGTGGVCKASKKQLQFRHCFPLRNYRDKIALKKLLEEADKLCSSLSSITKCF